MNKAELQTEQGSSHFSMAISAWYETNPETFIVNVCADLSAIWICVYASLSGMPYRQGMSFSVEDILV